MLSTRCNNQWQLSSSWRTPVCTHRAELPAEASLPQTP